MKRHHYFISTILAFSAITPSYANLVINGGFESPQIDPGTVYVHRNNNELTGWTSFSTYSGTVHFDTDYDLVSEGNQAVQIEVPGDWISQSIDTSVGQQYMLIFDLSAFYRYGSPNQTYTPCNPTCNSILGVSVGSVNEIFTGVSLSYTTYTLLFTALDSTTTLKFENLFEGDTFGNYPHLDNVSVVAVSPVPEPSSWILLVLAVVGISVLRKTYC